MLVLQDGPSQGWSETPESGKRCATLRYVTALLLRLLPKTEVHLHTTSLATGGQAGQGDFPHQSPCCFQIGETSL